MLCVILFRNNVLDLILVYTQYEPQDNLSNLQIFHHMDFFLILHNLFPSVFIFVSLYYDSPFIFGLFASFLMAVSAMALISLYPFYSSLYLQNSYPYVFSLFQLIQYIRLKLEFLLSSFEIHLMLILPQDYLKNSLPYRSLGYLIASIPFYDCK